MQNNFEKNNYHNHQPNFFQLRFSDKVFNQFSRFIYEQMGIHLSHSKKVMLQSRLTKRLRKLKINSFEEYFAYVTSDKGIAQEMPNLINAVTTNKTDFFREPKHFEFLCNIVLPEFYESCKGRKFKIWSAGCSTGAEPYTMAMLLEEFSVKHTGFRYAILSTDISTEVLDIARKGIYTHEMAQSIPTTLRKKYVLKKMGDDKLPLIQIVPELRQKIKFKQINLMDDTYSTITDIDAIFCRNVFIYFDRKTQERVIRQLCHHLKPQGYFFMGHSETIYMKNAPIKSVATTIYQKK